MEHLVFVAMTSLLVGVVLGALGGGGSILMVPVLVYVLGVPAQDAIATSLLVVGVTSAVAVLARWRSGQIRWRVGAMFGAAAMVGAFAGAKLARHLPADVLLISFAVLMVATAIAMLRNARVDAEYGVRATQIRTGLALMLGVVVGAISGLVGAGGGFLIVPVLALFAGLSMREAVATSLLVIAMQSLAGLFGHSDATHLGSALNVAATSTAALGSIVGSLVSARLPQRQLRVGFAWFVATMGIAILATQSHLASLAQAVADHRVLGPLIGGALIGVAAAMFWLFNGRVAGVSGIAGGLLRAPRGDRAWRGLFLAGLVGGGAWMSAFIPGAFEGVAMSPARLIVAGLLVGVGTTLANGCTSGHGICGVSRLSVRSWVATASFMTAGMLIVYVVDRGAGVLQ